jgi:hypothetical protein
VAYIHAVVLSPLNISLPTLKLLQIRSSKITDKILGLNLGNCFVLNQTFPVSLHNKDSSPFLPSVKTNKRKDKAEYQFGTKKKGEKSCLSEAKIV